MLLYWLASWQQNASTFNQYFLQSHRCEAALKSHNHFVQQIGNVFGLWQVETNSNMSHLNAQEKNTRHQDPKEKTSHVIEI